MRRIEIEVALAERVMKVIDLRADASSLRSVARESFALPTIVLADASCLRGQAEDRDILLCPPLSEIEVSAALRTQLGIELPPIVLPRLRDVAGFTPRSIREGLEHLVRNQALMWVTGRVRYSAHVDLPERGDAADLARSRVVPDALTVSQHDWVRVLSCATVAFGKEALEHGFPDLTRDDQALASLRERRLVAADSMERLFLGCRSLLVTVRESLAPAEASRMREILAEAILAEAPGEPLRRGEAGLELWRSGRLVAAKRVLLEVGGRLRDLGQPAATRRVLTPLVEMEPECVEPAERARALRLLAEVAALENRNELAAGHAAAALTLDAQDDDLARCCATLARTRIRSATQSDLLVAGDLIERGLAMPGASPFARAVLFTLESLRLRRLDRLSEALPIAALAVAAPEGAYSPELCGALLEQANALSDAMQYDAAIAAYDLMREVGVALGRFDIGAAASGSVARVHLLLGRVDEAERVLAQSESTHREVDLPGLTESTVVALLSARNFLGDVDGARQLIQRGPALFGPSSQPINRALFLRSAAETEMRCGNLDAADRFLAECLAIVRVLGDPEDIAKSEAALAALRAWRGDLTGARAAFASALRRIRPHETGAEVFVVLAEFHAWRGRPSCARRLARRVLLTMDTCIPRAIRPEVWLALAVALQREGSPDVAEFTHEGLALATVERDGTRAQLEALEALSRTEHESRAAVESRFETALEHVRSPGHTKERVIVLLLRAAARLRIGRRLLVGAADEAGAATAALSGAFQDVDRATRLAREVEFHLDGHAALSVRTELEALERDSRTSVALRSLDRRLEGMERLLEINRAINAELDPQRLLSLVLDSAIDLTGARRGFLVLVKGERIDVKIARNFSQQDITHPEFEISHSVARGVARTGDPILTSNAQSDSRLRSIASIHELRVLSVLCVPLRSRNQIMGSVYLDHPDVVDRFDAADLQVLVDFAWAAGIALERARLYQENLEHTRDLLRAKQENERLNAELVKRVAQQELALNEAQDTIDAEHRAQKWRYDYRNFVSASPRMDEVKRMLDRITETDFPVLVQGESGTGKELVARAIHFNGRRAAKSFVPVNCAAMTESLIEADLFGHVRGAFTGADRDRKGFFELANEGTLFLDEIGDMSLEAQKRLLRVVQHNEFYRIGAKEPTRVDVRIICATHRDLKAMVAAKSFREDLYYRLRVAYVELPPLREREGDVRLLTTHLIDELKRAGQAPPRRFTDAALAVLEQYSWPGNVRELQNEVKRLLFLRSDAPWIEASELPSFIQGGQPIGVVATTSGSLKERLAQCEQWIVTETIAQAKQNKSEAARRLGISIRGLYKILERFKPGSDALEESGPEAPGN